MADFSDGYQLIRAMADNDWYGASATELGLALGWEYQKTNRVLKDLAEAKAAHQQPNGAWRLSATFLEILTAAQASFIDRLNQLQPQRKTSTEEEPENTTSVVIDVGALKKILPDEKMIKELIGKSVERFCEELKTEGNRDLEAALKRAALRPMQPVRPADENCTGAPCTCGRGDDLDAMIRARAEKTRLVNEIVNLPTEPIRLSPPCPCALDGSVHSVKPTDEHEKSDGRLTTTKCRNCGDPMKLVANWSGDGDDALTCECGVVRIVAGDEPVRFVETAALP